MQAPGSPANQYLANKVMTASPQELTLMLYDGAIKFCTRAINNIENAEIEEAHKSLIKAQNIIEEFMIVVDRKIEVGNNLFLMYDYMYRRLVEANLKKDTAIVDEVIHLIRELRDAWKIAMDKEKGIYVEPAPQAEAPAPAEEAPASVEAVEEQPEETPEEKTGNV